MIKLAVDAMGSDKGSPIVVEAIKKFHEEHKDVEFYVCGKKEELTELESFCTIIDARDVMQMEDGALEVMRKRETSMMKAVELVANGTCEGVVSAGSTGGFLTAATIKLKLIPGVLRAALLTTFPTLDGKGVVITDIGASNENTPEHLAQFARIGSIFAKSVRKVESPRVYLLSNGAEEKKGTPLIKEAHQLIKNSNFEYFKGNLEARYALTGEADVIITNGFDGNVLLKSTEGTAKMMSTLLKKAFKKNIFTKIGYLFARSGIKEMTKTMDYKQYGGAMLIGVNGVVVKGHGSSDAYSFYNAIRVTKEMVESGVVASLKEAMAKDE